MHPDDHRLLMMLAYRSHQSMAEWVQEQIRTEAKREKLK
jgi:predicted HicB family RNase H-like nuclease